MSLPLLNSKVSNPSGQGQGPWQWQVADNWAHRLGGVFALVNYKEHVLITSVSAELTCLHRT